MTNRATFETAASDLAQQRGHVTAAALAVELGISAADAKRQLQTMYDAGALELDLEDDQVVYRLKGAAQRGAIVSAPTPKTPTAATEDQGEDDEDNDDESIGENLKEATAAMMTRGKTALTNVAVGALLDEEGAAEVADAEQKSLLWGVGLGLFLPGVGLFYSAPIVTASIASAVVLLTLGVLQWIPLFGVLLSYFLFGFFMLVSAGLGGAYSYYFNKTGRRTRLSKGGKGLRSLPF